MRRNIPLSLLLRFRGAVALFSTIQVPLENVMPMGIKLLTNPRVVYLLFAMVESTVIVKACKLRIQRPVCQTVFWNKAQTILPIISAIRQNGSTGVNRDGYNRKVTIQRNNPKKA